MAYHISQDELGGFLGECRRCLGREGDLWTALIVDEWDGIYDMPRLATQVDVLSFSRHRRGFGGARRAAVHEAQAAEAEWAVVVDADGQHDAPAIEKVLTEALESDWEAVIPQRTLIDLPLLDAGDVDRKAAERFESWYVVRASGQAELDPLDIQPGLLLLRRSALDLLAARVRTRGYSWDLEAVHCLLRSDLRLGFPRIESRPQPTTFFSTEDSRGNFRFLASIVGGGPGGGAEDVRKAFAEFRERGEFGGDVLDALGRHLEEALFSAPANVS
jgi:hypothetical protein